jgi:hypothetical protein
MATTDPRIDAYIEKSAEFARPILQRLRKIVHQGCPAAVETIKWRMPFFEYKGLFCGMAAFKAHCAFFFWRDIEVSPEFAKAEGGMGQFGKIASIGDLPKDAVILGIVRSGVKLRDATAARPKAAGASARKPAKEPLVPADLKRALAGAAKAADTFKNFSPSHRREYVAWIMDAKRPETRAKRLATTIEWLSEGKPQNWRYLEKK